MKRYDFSDGEPWACDHGDWVRFDDVQAAIDSAVAKALAEAQTKYAFRHWKDLQAADKFIGTFMGVPVVATGKTFEA
jgi:hypothetical protein